MKCIYCKRELPEQKEKTCPYCFAAWTPEGVEADKAEAEEPKTVLGRN